EAAEEGDGPQPGGVQRQRPPQQPEGQGQEAEQADEGQPPVLQRGRHDRTASASSRAVAGTSPPARCSVAVEAPSAAARINPKAADGPWPDTVIVPSTGAAPPSSRASVACSAPTRSIVQAGSPAPSATVSRSRMVSGSPSRRSTARLHTGSPGRAAATTGGGLASAGSRPMNSARSTGHPGFVASASEAANDAAGCSSASMRAISDCSVWSIWAAASAATVSLTPAALGAASTSKRSLAKKPSRPRERTLRASATSRSGPRVSTAAASDVSIDEPSNRCRVDDKGDHPHGFDGERPAHFGVGQDGQDGSASRYQSADRRPELRAAQDDRPLPEPFGLDQRPVHALQQHLHALGVDGQERAGVARPQHLEQRLLQARLEGDRLQRVAHGRLGRDG